MSPEAALAALGVLGVTCRAEDIRLERHDDRWLAFLPEHQLAVFPASAKATLGADRERAVLRAIERCCSFGAPRILAVAPDRSCDLRAMVPGTHSTLAVYDRVRDDVPNAERVGAAIGAMMAEWHTRLRASDLGVQLPSLPEWPKSRGWVLERLPFVVEDRALEAAAAEVIGRYEDSEPAGAPADRVLVHTDVGLHNISIDSKTLEVYGIFDWEGACWSDRHLDFRHLVFADSHPFFESAVRAYEAGTDVRVSRARVYLHNAAMAVTYLAFREGHAPDERWCGRTLSEDLEWTRMAIARVIGR